MKLIVTRIVVLRTGGFSILRYRGAHKVVSHPQFCPLNGILHSVFTYNAALSGHITTMERHHYDWRGNQTAAHA